MSDEHPSKCPKLQFKEIDRDPGSCKQICEFPINKQDEIRRAYLKEDPYQYKNIDIHTVMILIVVDFNLRIGPPMYKFLATPLPSRAIFMCHCSLENCKHYS